MGRTVTLRMYDSVGGVMCPKFSIICYIYIYYKIIKIYIECFGRFCRDGCWGVLGRELACSGRRIYIHIITFFLFFCF